MSKTLEVAAAVLLLSAGCCFAMHHTQVFGRSTACATDCPKASKFMYKTNMVHVFDYHTSAKFVSGSREPQLGATARAHITIAGPCEMILAVSHVRLADSSDSSPGFAAAIERNSLRFAFQDGRVSSLCPDMDEPRWVLNFKRALLSVFQNNMPDLRISLPAVVEETDVSGTCSSTYTAVHGDAGIVNVTRTRSASCVPPAEPQSAYLLTNLLQHLPFLSTEQKCLQMISGGALKETLCRENFRYPSLLTSEGDHPIAVLTARLMHVYQFKVDFVVIPNYQARRCSLELEWEDRDEQSPPDDWLSVISDILEQLPASAPSPSSFYQLTEILRTLSYDQISETLTQISPDLWDTASMALLKIGTEPAMKMFLDFMKYNAIDRDILEEAEDYLMSFFEINSSMIDIIQMMFDNNKFMYGDDQKSVVPLTKLKNYCIDNTQCTKDKRIQEIFKNATSKYGSVTCGHPVNKTKFHGSSPDYKTLQSLAYLSALGEWSGNVTNKLEHCIRSNVSEIQYSALQVMQNSPCQMHDYDDLLRFAENDTLDSYTQILTYLTLMRCPSADLETVLLNKLRVEPVNQVTSYIWTYLSNQKNLEWVNVIMSNSQLITKYQDKALKFSRNFFKEVIVGNTSFAINFDIIFSGFSLRPQYVRLRVSSDKFMPNDLFEFEVREKNVTRKVYDYGSYSEYPSYYSYRSFSDDSDPTANVTSSTLDEASTITVFNTKPIKKIKQKWEVVTKSLIIVRFMGLDLCESERRLDGLFNSFGFTSILEHVTAKVYEFFTEGPLSYGYVFMVIVEAVFQRLPIMYQKKFDLIRRYPTSIGMPFQCQLNMTKGVHKGSLLPSAAKQFEATMLIDATHTNVGMKVISKTSIFPGLNFSMSDDGYSIIIKLPEQKNTLLDFKCEKYNIENNKLTPRFFSNETAMDSFCLPGLKNLSGSTLCVEYCPKSKWWPVSNLRYRLVYDREDGIVGYNITGRLKSRLYELSFEVLDKPESTWRASIYHLAYFTNIQLLTPYLSLNGSGTFKSEVLRLKQSGQALNISGTLSCNNEVVPFILTGESKMREKPEQDTFNVFFYSSLFEGTILTTYELGENKTFDATIPYRIKDNATQSIRITSTGLRYDLTSEAMTNATTEVGTNVVRTECTGSVTFSEYPQTVMTMKFVSDNGKGFNGTDTMDGNITMACDEHRMEAIMTTRCNRDTREYICTLEAQKPNQTVVWSKGYRSEGGDSKAWSNLVCNDNITYEVEANYGTSMERGLYSTASLLVPCSDPNATHPLVQLSYDQKFNLFEQQYHIVCSKAYKGNSVKLNMTAGILLDKNTGLPLDFGNSMQHHGVLELSCSNHDPFRVEANSKLSTSMRDLDLYVDVHTPFKRWDKEAFKLKLLKKGAHLKTTLTEKRRQEDPAKYELEGSMDYDIINNIQF